MLRIKIARSGSVIVIASAVFVTALVVSAGAYYVLGRNNTNSNEYRGYEQGMCNEGYYEAWGGGAPTGDPKLDNVCLSKSEIDSREKGFEEGMTLKPVIMLYADQDTDFSLTQKFDVSDSFIYPAYNQDNGWYGTVLGGPNGDILVDHREYDYLFWEGVTADNYDFSTGNIVTKADTTAFLEQALAAYGLNARETGDFITFWAPKLMKHDYNIISFVNDQYAASHPLEVTPMPDYVQRVFMVYKQATATSNVSRVQTFEPVEKRHGFSLIEWGGREIVD
ncbi:hypothetical protein KC878_02545 [Candidatus Saccharibacteria bacterium]|nr:hypothetical protein [Candidatus Saccharibacteria bacterium]